MADFLMMAACAILLTVALAMFLVMRHPVDADRMMVVQLLGSGGIAVVLLTGVANGQTAVIDVALVLALLAVFAGLSFVKAVKPPQAADTEDT